MTKNLLHDSEGAAFVETLVVLPVLVTALAGIVGVHGMYGATLEAKAEARRLAWLQADSGNCPSSTCRSEECARSAATIQQDGLDQAESASSAGAIAGSFFGRIRRGLGAGATTGVGLASAPRPGLPRGSRGSNRFEQRATLPLLCNTTPRTADGLDVLTRACAHGLSTVEFASEVCR